MYEDQKTNGRLQCMTESAEAMILSHLRVNILLQRPFGLEDMSLTTSLVNRISLARR